MNRKIRAIAACLLIISLLTACGESAQQPEDTAPVDSAAGTLPGTELGVRDAADDVFSLNYNSSLSLNPYATTDNKNLLVTQLVCDNVFELDDDYNLTSRIVTNWTVSAEGTWWTPTIDTSIPMHDGSTLTAADVAYSIQLARNSARYSGRFSNLYGVSSSGDDTVNISTAKPDLQLLYLLTVPEVRS